MPLERPLSTPAPGLTSAGPSDPASRADGGAAPADPMLERRLVELEIKASYTEDLLDTLNALVTRQQAQIDRLQQEVAEWRRREEDPSGPGFRSLRDELPPHY